MTTKSFENKESTFQWQCQPEAAHWVESIVEHCVECNEELASFAHALEKETSTRLFDWVDHVAVPSAPTTDDELESIGFVADAAAARYRIFEHPGAQLPKVVVQDSSVDTYALAIKVESIDDFLMVRAKGGHIEGSPLSDLRRVCISADNGVSFWIIERRTSRGMEPVYLEESHLRHYLAAQELWQTRPRCSDDEDGLMSRTLALADRLVQMVGKDMAAWIVLDVERRYWQSRNTAGQIQKARQDKLGMGWANHDHHTFRSSRRHFPSLVRLFEMLGFHCRERYYAGAEAGWGAQIMENRSCGLVLFLDVDLQPDEIGIDFAHHPLPETKTLGTVGLWCALHGDSILKAGMHHLEAQFQFDLLRSDLEEKKVHMMQPFSDFAYLKQAFTVGERWPVERQVVEKLIEKRLLSKEDAERFIRDGAIGSHLENLQRREGYKGFNQKNVSFIIRKTDPRLC